MSIPLNYPRRNVSWRSKLGEHRRAFVARRSDRSRLRASGWSPGGEASPRGTGLGGGAYASLPYLSRAASFNAGIGNACGIYNCVYIG